MPSKPLSVALAVSAAVFCAALIKYLCGWPYVFGVLATAGLATTILLAWTPLISPAVCGLSELGRNFCSSLASVVPDRLALTCASLLVTIGAIGFAWSAPTAMSNLVAPLLRNSWIAWIAGGLLTLAYVLGCLVVMRFKLFTPIEDRSSTTSHNFLHYIPRGAFVQTVLAGVAFVLSVSIYERIDRNLHNQIVDNAAYTQSLLLENARLNVECRLRRFLEVALPFLTAADKETVSTLVEKLKADKTVEFSTNWQEVVVKPRYTYWRMSDAKLDEKTGLFVQKVDGADISLNQREKEAVERWQDDPDEIGDLISDRSLLLQDNGKLHAWVRELLVLNTSQADARFPFNLNFLALTLGDDTVDEWRIDYSSKIVGQRTDLWETCVTDYTFPRSFEVSRRWGDQLDGLVTTTEGLERGQALFFFAALLAEAGTPEFSPKLWRTTSAKIPLREPLGAGQFQDLINRRVLQRIGSHLPVAQIAARVAGNETERSGETNCAGQPMANTWRMEKARYLLGLDPPTTRALIRGPIQLFTLLLCIWGLLFLLVCRIPECCWEFGYMPMRAHIAGKPSDKGLWLDFWRLETIDPSSTNRMICNLYTEAGATDDLVPRLLETVLLARKSGLNVSQVTEAGQRVIKSWREEKANQDKLLDVLIFALPNIGFLGTIVGLTRGLGLVYAIGIPSEDPFHKAAIIAAMSTQLGTAFYTTLVALLCLLPLAFFTYWLQRTEDFIAKRAEAVLQHVVARL